jgi:hypothetical protein
MLRLVLCIFRHLSVSSARSCAREDRFVSPFLDPQSLSEAIANYVHERRQDVAQTVAIDLVTRADLLVKCVRLHCNNASQ